MNIFNRSMRRFLAGLFSFIVATGMIFPSAMAHSGDEIQTPYGTSPVIDGVIEQVEWNDANSINITIEGNDAEILFKHDRENLYVGFDIQEGHNSVFPDTRIFLDTHHDGAGSPQVDDFELYINPDNGGLREQQGNGSTWQQVNITDWDGAWQEDGTDHWSTEYVIRQGKLGNGSDGGTGNMTFGIAFLVYGNVWGFSTTWPDNADENNPSTWGNIIILNWTEETSDNEDPLPPPPPPPGDNETNANGTNGTGNATESDDNDDFVSGFPYIEAVCVFITITALTRWKRKMETK